MSFWSGLFGGAASGAASGAVGGATGVPYGPTRSGGNIASSSPGFFDNFLSSLGSKEVLGAGLYGALGLASGLASNSSNYGNTEEGFNQSLALQYAQIDAAAKNQAASIAAQLQAAGISADAAIKAANIQVAGMVKKAKIDAMTTITGYREKALADSIAQRIEAKKGQPELLTKAQEDTNAARIATGQAGQQGFTNAANVLAAFRK